MDDFSPNQIGVPITRMSASITWRWMAGQSSRSKPCSVMSGCTPGAMSWSTARMFVTVTPTDRISSIELFISVWVCE